MNERKPKKERTKLKTAKKQHTHTENAAEEKEPKCRSVQTIEKREITWKKKTKDNANNNATYSDATGGRQKRDARKRGSKHKHNVTKQTQARTTEE